MKNFTLWSGKVLGLLLTAFTFNAQAQFCDEAQGGLPGFPSDPACETAVCSIDPFCCETSWDGLCGSTAATLAECSGCVNPGNGGGDPICVAEPIEGVTVCDYDTASAAYSIVIAEDPFCCNTSWDSLCQTSYEGLGGLPNPDPSCDSAGGCIVELPTCATDEAAVAAIQAEDDFCCSVAWDDVCQALYNSISETCGGNPSPDDCTVQAPECVDDVEAYGIVVALEPACCNVAWDADCQALYNFLSTSCSGDDCLNGTGFGTATLSDSDTPVTISTCQFLSEYATVNGVIAGETYLSNYELDGFSTGYVTVREGTPDGPVVAAGQAPLSWTANASATHYVHYNEDELCGTSSFCGVSTIQCTSCEPSNVGDPCEEASPIACGDEVSGSTVGAGLFTVPFCGTPDGTGGKVFYSFTGTGESVTASLCGSTFDTKIWVFEGGDCNNLICVGGNDDFAGCGLQSQFSWESVAGTEYFIVVGGFGTAEGGYTLTVECSEEPIGCPAEVPECVTDEAAYEIVISQDSFCCETLWDGLCQESYDSLSNTCASTDEGCTYPAACNFDPAALIDDGSCEFTSCAGCTYPDALNFNPVAVYDDGSCVFDPSDCVDNCPGDFNGDNVVNTSDLLTFLSVFGTICD